MRPTTLDEASEVMRDASAAGTPVRFTGGETKLNWGSPPEREPASVSTLGLGAVIEHNPADLTAVLEPGVTLSAAQKAFAEHGQMLAVDPPVAERATIGGIVSTADSGPLRHRYGGIRDLVLGMTIILADGTIAKSGSKVIKNVAGYDIAKLFSGAFGTLGMIGRVAVRLHPRPPRSVTVRFSSEDPAALAGAAGRLAHLPLEADSLDLEWTGESGDVAARFGGAAPEGRAESAMRALSGAELVEDDDDLWKERRAAQRESDGMVVKVSALPTELGRVVSEARRLGGRVVARAGLGIAYVTVAGETADLVAAVDELRTALRPHSCVVQDAPLDVRRKIDVWGEQDAGVLALARRIKQRFDPAGILSPGTFLGGI